MHMFNGLFLMLSNLVKYASEALQSCYANLWHTNRYVYQKQDAESLTITMFTDRNMHKL